MKEQFYNPEIELLQKFAELRKKTHEEIEKETAERIKDNPHPTEEEIAVGAFKEMIEPQVRDAIFECYRKGYSTASSGFGGEYGEQQAMDGFFEIDNETKRKIEALGVNVLKGKEVGMLGESPHYTWIIFKPENSDIDEIKKKWDEIVAVLPKRKESAMPSISGGAEEFRKQYAPDRTDIEKKVLESRLNLEESHPDIEEKMRQRIKELS